MSDSERNPFDLLIEQIPAAVREEITAALGNGRQLQTATCCFARSGISSKSNR